MNITRAAFGGGKEFKVMAIVLMATLGVVTIVGVVCVTLLMLSSQTNTEAKASIVVVFVLQIIKMIYDQFCVMQAEIQRARLQTSIDEVKANSEEAVGSARADIATYVKEEMLTELDALADGFVKKTLDLPQSKRFLELLTLRLEDNLTKVQKSKVRRAIEIMERDIRNPLTADKPPAEQSHEEARDSKESQTRHENQQREDGTRKERES